MLPHLETVERFAHSQSDLCLSLERIYWSLGGVNDRLQLPFGRPQKLLSFARSLILQQRVAAGDQPLVRKLRTVNLAKVSIIKERELESGPRHQLFDLRDPQSGDPTQPFDTLKVLA
jgi:hypothetical protein